MALDTTPLSFRTLFPEFDPVPEDRIQICLDSVIDEFSPASWGSRYAEAVLTFSAHLLCLSESRIASATVSEGGAVSVPQSGQIQSATAENLTVAFVAGNRTKSANEEWLAQSNYGQAFAAMRRRFLSRGRLSWR